MNIPRATALFFTATLTCIAPLSCAADLPTPPTAPRIVAVGDLHGDREQALAALRLAGVVDAEGHWSGADTTLVQTGDTTDRGPQSKEVLDLVRRLQTEAATAGGKVVALLGNHEIMNLQGDWRYVHPDDVEGFGGLDARVAALSTDGAYGAWLRGLDGVALEGDAIFVHGSVSETWAAMGITGINEAVHRALAGGAPEVLGEGGPFWYRGFAQDAEAKACPALGRALAALGAKRMVVGHTTQRSGRIGVRCDGRLHLIDTGISAHYGGNLAVWEWTKGDARALYATGTEDLEDPEP